MPMKVTDGAPPTQKWVPQTEPLNLNRALGYVEPDGGYSALPVNVHLEDLDPAVQHRIESWTKARDIIARIANCDLDNVVEDATDWLAANAPEES